MFAFSTHAILGGDCAARVISTLPATLDDDTRFCVRVCLHEALYNAALHGNLGIDDIHHKGITQQVQDRLKDPHRGSRPVYVTCDITGQDVCIAVQDFGEGSVNLPPLNACSDIRGLSLMRRLSHDVTFDPTIRTLMMRFLWKGASDATPAP